MQTYAITFRAMGCQANVWLETARDGALILQQVPGWIEAIEASLSRFRPDSELSHLNARTEQWENVSATMYAAVSEARRAARVTDGLVTPLVLPALLAAGYDRSFDTLHDDPSLTASPHDADPPSNVGSLSQWDAIQLDAHGPRVWLPGPVDLGGTAKGWATKVIADQLAEYGPCLVDLGGDIVGRGKPWPVQVHDPFQPDTPFATFALADQAVATSGTDFRRWGAGKHHIIDPRSAMPATTDLMSVTVIHPDAVLADAFAKAVLLQGSFDGLAWLAQQPDAAALAFDHEGRVLATENFLPYITQGA
jgi:thiamine biosynthesis lipoprotein